MKMTIFRALLSEIEADSVFILASARFLPFCNHGFGKNNIKHCVQLVIMVFLRFVMNLGVHAYLILGDLFVIYFEAGILAF